MTFGEVVILGHHHHYLVLIHFYHPIKQSLPIPPNLQPLATANLLFISVDLPILGIS